MTSRDHIPQTREHQHSRRQQGQPVYKKREPGPPEQRPGNLSKTSAQSVHNRIMAVMEHTTRYAFKGASRLALDAGISKSALSRLINGQSSPSFALVVPLTQALEQQLGVPLDPRELISFDGTYPTPFVCQLVGCRGCLPAEAYDEENNLKPEYKQVKPGQWTPQQLTEQRTEASSFALNLGLGSSLEAAQ